MNTQTTKPVALDYIVDSAVRMVRERGGTMPLVFLMDLAGGQAKTWVDGEHVIKCSEQTWVFESLVGRLVREHGATISSAPLFYDRAISLPNE